MLLTASTSHGQCWGAPSSSGAACIEERRRHGTWLSASQERSSTQLVGVVYQSATVSAAPSDPLPPSHLSPRGSSFPRHRKPPRPWRALWGHGRLIPVGHGRPGGALLCGTNEVEMSKLGYSTQGFPSRSGGYCRRLRSGDEGCAGRTLGYSVRDGEDSFIDFGGQVLSRGLGECLVGLRVGVLW